MTDLVRSTSLTNYAEVARSVGIDPAEMLRKVGLPLACLSEDMRIPVSGARRLLEASAIAAGVDEFGLLMADRCSLTQLGPVALVVREQRTVGLAIEALSRYVHLHNEAVRINVKRQNNVVTLALFLRGTRPRAPPQAAEMTLGTLYRVISSLLTDWRPLEVHLTRSRPINFQFYRRFFGCSVVFDSDFNGIACHAIDMDRSIPSADPLMARYVQDQMKAIQPRSEKWEDKVSEIVRSLMPRGQCTIDRVAQHLGCNRRTIHRHLSENGTSFSEILDAERVDLVTRLIEDSNRPLLGITALLGFSAQSAMARWFRGRFGCSLTQWRNGVRPNSSAPITREVMRKGRSAKVQSSLPLTTEVQRT